MPYRKPKNKPNPQRDGIFKRSENGIYYGWLPSRYKKGLPARVSLKTRDFVKAKRRYEHLLATEADEPSESPIRIQEFFNDYLNTHSKPPRKSEKYCRLERYRLNRILNYLQSKGCSNLKDITPQIVESLKSSLIDQKLAPKTINDYIIQLKTVLNIALNYDYIEKNPTKIIKMLKVTNVRSRKAFTKKEIKTILEMADDDTGQYIRLILLTGVRLSELANLRWDDIDLENRHLIVQSKDGFAPKSRKVRYIDLSNEAIEFFNDLSRNGKYIFCNGSGNKRYKDPGDYTKRINAVLREAGLYQKGFGAHTLRHTYISMLCQAGVPITTVKELAGHADIQTTMKYIHLTPGHRRSVVEKLEFLP